MCRTTGTRSSPSCCSFKDFSIEHSGLTADDVRVASEEVDRLGPFKGHKIDPDQPHELPRTFINPMQYPRGVLADEPYEVPFGVLAWVALRAHGLWEERTEFAPSGPAYTWTSVTRSIHDKWERDLLLYGLRAQTEENE